MSSQHLDPKVIRYSQSSITGRFHQGKNICDETSDFVEDVYDRNESIKVVRYPSEEYTSYDNKRIYWAREQPIIACTVFDADASCFEDGHLAVLYWESENSKDNGCPKRLHEATVIARDYSAWVALKCSRQGPDFPLCGRLQLPSVSNGSISLASPLYRLCRTKKPVVEAREISDCISDLQPHLARKGSIYVGLPNGTLLYSNENWPAYLQGSGFENHFECVMYETYLNIYIKTLGADKEKWDVADREAYDSEVQGLTELDDICSEDSDDESWVSEAEQKTSTDCGSHVRAETAQEGSASQARSTYSSSLCDVEAPTRTAQPIDGSTSIQLVEKIKMDGVEEAVEKKEAAVARAAELVVAFKGMESAGDSARDFPLLADCKRSVQPLLVPAQLPNIDLDIEAVLELEQMQENLGLLSYYNHRGSKIVVHAEDAKAFENSAIIEKQVRDLVKRCSKNPEIIDVIFSPYSFNMVPCGRIGDAIRVNTNKQVIGMYLCIRDGVYWTSVAHNFIPFTSESEEKQIENIGDLNTPVIIDDRSLAGAPTPCHACCMIKPRGASGQKLLHTVDLMIGPLPLMTCHLQDGESHPLALKGMRDVRDPCPNCRDILCTQQEHQQGQIHYSIRKIYFPTRLSNGHYDLYNLPENMRPSISNSTVVYSYSFEKGLMHGRVCSDQAHVHNRNLSYEVLSAIFVEPLGNENPDVGDCGTVWVLKDTSEAIAMTVAMGDLPPETLPRRRVWVAQLLAPCFDALCAMHSNVFPNMIELNPL